MVRPSIRNRAGGVPRISRGVWHSIIAATAVVALSGVAIAEDRHPPEGHVQYRQKLMSAIGYHTAAIGDILKYGLGMTDHIEKHAHLIGESAELVAAAFKPRISEGATDAKPEIWEDWDHYMKDLKEFSAAAGELEKAAKGGDMAAIGAAMKGLGDSCSDCHKSFRKPKEESYKNK